MASALLCWKCGVSLEELPVPLARLAECPDCHADLHSCRMCRFFDAAVANQCREPVAEAVNDKERANFCGWFQASGNAYRPGEGGKSAADRARLESLFGGGGGAGNAEGISGDAEAREQLEKLFRK